MIGLVMWAEAVERDLQAAGFVVTRCNGLPFVKHAGELWDVCESLTFVPSVPVERFFHRGGTLYVPPGVAALRKGTPVS